ncbi:MAG: acetate kinase [Bryobacteraceae bacterium]|jgi:acetate kinase
MKILVLNGGSSSIKCWFQDVPDGRRWTARADWKTSGTPESLLGPLLQSLWQGEKKAIDSPAEIDVVGHRIVHGGPQYRDSVLVTPEVRAAIAEQAEFAPAHNKLELTAIETVDRIIGAKVPQVAVFDTAFHATLAPAAYVYPGPYQWLEQGIRRYGFHGISVQYSTRRAAELLRVAPNSSRLIVCHLGNGASVTAVANGKSVDTSMGFTPLEGIMMGTRSGSIDPSILVYLIRHQGYSGDQIDEILNRKSGLLGVSGLSGDMREILEAMNKGNDRARLAYQIYAHRLTREIGAMVAVLGGVDAIVFTAGIGESCAPLREVVCGQLSFLGLKLNLAKNAQPDLDQNIAAANSAVQVLVIRADEDSEIARECLRLRSTLPARA